MIDGHNDLPWAMRVLCDYDLDAVDLAAGAPSLHTDLPRLRAGGVTGQFWSVFVPASLAGEAAVTATLEQVAFVLRLVERYPDTFALADSAAGVERARSQGRIASLLGMEGGHSINESLGVLHAMRALGVRYLTLTHNDNVPWADSATDTPVHGGLSAFGEDVVREMNRLGMLVDLSHVSPDTMRHALKVTDAPAIFSHSSARALCDVPRNVPDDVLSTLAGNGGVCMVTFVPQFVSPDVAAWDAQVKAAVEAAGGSPRDHLAVTAAATARAQHDPPPRASVNDVVAHVEHVREVAGVEHVGLGGDYDGVAFTSQGLEDVASYPRLFDALRARGWSAADLDRLAYGNILRVLHDTDQPAAP